MAITGISSYDGKQIIAAGAQSAISAGIASNLVWTAGTSANAGFFNGNQYASGGFYVESKDGTKDVEICPDYIQFSNSTYTPVTSQAIQITSGKVTAWDSLSTNKQDKLTFNYDGNSQITGINSSAIAGGGGSFPASAAEACGVVTANSANWNSTKTTVNTYSGNWNDTRNTVGTNSANWGAAAVVTATGGTTAYVQTINGKNISATSSYHATWTDSATYALNATNADNLTNTAIKVASATSASTAYTLGNTAIKVASATSATNANTATYASNGVSLTNIYNSARSGYAASAYLAANVTGNTAGWQKAFTHLTPHIFQGVQYTAFDTSWGHGNSPVAQPWIVTATNGQGTEVNIRLNYGKILPNCSAVTGKVAVYPVDKQFNGSTLEADSTVWYRVDIDLAGKGYYGPQWTHYQGAVELSGCWSPIGLASTMFCEWSQDTQVQVVHNDAWNNTAYVNVIDVIHRDINTAIGDNNKWHMNASFLIRGYGN